MHVRPEAIDRRTFGRGLLTAAAAATLMPARTLLAEEDDDARVETVAGHRRASELGATLPHEHVLVDFIGADRVSKERYDADEVMRHVEPHLQRVRAAGCRTIVECTPAYLGRDPELLRRLAEATGMQILTNTGYYGAANGKYLPPQAHTDSADQLAQRWIAEWRDGIDQTGIRPGFIKIGVDGGPLNEVNRKLVEAAAHTYKATGLTIAAHTGDGLAAQEQLRILHSEGVNPAAWIWVHAQVENDVNIHRQLAEAGGWIEFDGVAPDSIDRHVELVLNMKQHALLDRVLVSQDAGWYWVGEPAGGNFRPYDTLFTVFLPALRAAGLTDEQVRQLTVDNPARAFAVDRM
jgi:phosphotriesterase-related protein